MAKSPPGWARGSSAAVGLRASERERERESERERRMKLGTMAGGGSQAGGERLPQEGGERLPQRRAKAPSSDAWSRQGLRAHASRGGRTLRTCSV